MGLILLMFPPLAPLLFLLEIASSRVILDLAGLIQTVALWGWCLNACRCWLDTYHFLGSASWTSREDLICLPSILPHSPALIFLAPRQKLPGRHSLKIPDFWFPGPSMLLNQAQWGQSSQAWATLIYLCIGGLSRAGLKFSTRNAPPTLLNQAW